MNSPASTRLSLALPCGSAPRQPLAVILATDLEAALQAVQAAGGRISLPAGSPSGDEQRARLRMEGISILNNRVDIQRHGWRPVEHSG